MPRMVMTEDISEEENQRRYDAVMDHIRNMKPPKFMEWWRVENTGWSNGTSWFASGGTEANPYRAASLKEATEYATQQQASWSDPAIKWRVVHVTLERNDNKSVTTEVWTEL